LINGKGLKWVFAKTAPNNGYTPFKGTWQQTLYETPAFVNDIQGKVT
jgi:hypothetical protein